MTLIAAVVTEGGTVLFSDALITTRLGLPGIVNKLPLFEGQWRPQNIHVVDLIRKNHCFGSAGFMLWAGKEAVALRLITDLHQLLEVPNQHRSLADTLNKYAAEEVDYILMVNHPGGEIDLLHKGCSEQDWPGLGKLFVAGSGAAEFLGLLAPDGNGDFLHDKMFTNGEEGSVEKAVAFALTMDTKLTSVLSLFEDPIENAWGGVIETFILRPSGFIPIPYPLYTFSKVQTDGSLAPYLKLVTKEVVGDSLVVGIWGVDHEDGKARHYLVRDATVTWEEAKSRVSASAFTSSIFKHQTDVVVIDPEDDRSDQLAYYPRTKKNLFRSILRSNISRRAKRRKFDLAIGELQSKVSAALGSPA